MDSEAGAETGATSQGLQFYRVWILMTDAERTNLILSCLVKHARSIKEWERLVRRIHEMERQVSFQGWQAES
jgi:hypothetical protein